MVRYTLGPRIEIILYFNVIYREERSLARVRTRTPLSPSVTRHPDKVTRFADITDYRTREDSRFLRT